MQNHKHTIEYDEVNNLGYIRFKNRITKLDSIPVFIEELGSVIIVLDFDKQTNELIGLEHHDFSYHFDIND